MSKEDEQLYLKNLKQDKKIKIDQVEIPSFLVCDEEKKLKPAMEAYSEAAKKICLEVVKLISIERLRDNIDIQKWVESGLILHLEHGSNSCEFCTQSIPENRLPELKGFFNEQDQELKVRVDALSRKLKNAHSTIEKMILPDSAKLYSEIQELYEEKKTDFKKNQSNLLEEITNFRKKVKSKKESTDKEIDVGAFPQTSPLINLIGEINSLINKHNEKTDEFDGVMEKSKENLECHYLATIYDDIQSIEKEITSLENKKKEKEFQIEEIEGKIIQNESKISFPQIACDDMNEKLGIFLGRKEISFSISESREDGKYLIERNKQPARNLSEGEKTAIALIYFLTSLKEGDFQISNSVIFIDDPVSSLDSNAMTQAFAFIKNEIKNAEQVFISTHNYQFFKKIQSWIGKPSGEPQDNANFYMIKNFIGSEKDRRAKIEKIDSLITRYNSEYQYLFSMIYKYSKIEDPREIKAWYPLPNIARKFMESFLSFTVPSKRIFTDQLREAFERNQSICLTGKDRIQNFLNSKSHMFPEGMSGFDLDNFCEIQEVLKDILAFVKSTNEEHYQQLCKVSN